MNVIIVYILKRYPPLFIDSYNLFLLYFNDTAFENKLGKDYIITYLDLSYYQFTSIHLYNVHCFQSKCSLQAETY